MKLKCSEANMNVYDFNLNNNVVDLANYVVIQQTANAGKVSASPKDSPPLHALPEHNRKKKGKRSSIIFVH